jgi:hypothetical protein
VQTIKTSVHGAINMLGLAKRVNECLQPCGGHDVHVQILHRSQQGLVVAAL